MVTTVGTSTELATLIENFIYLERDAIAAYDATAERLTDPRLKEKIAAFREDHHRHLDELLKLAAKHGAEAPAEGDMKQVLTTGKVKLASMVGGDGAILQAMSTNETDTISAYESGCKNEAVPPEDRAIFERGLADERRHKEWMLSAAEAA